MTSCNEIIQFTVLLILILISSICISILFANSTRYQLCLLTLRLNITSGSGWNKIIQNESACFSTHSYSLEINLYVRIYLSILICWVAAVFQPDSSIQSWTFNKRICYIFFIEFIIYFFIFLGNGLYCTMKSWVLAVRYSRAL